MPNHVFHWIPTQYANKPYFKVVNRCLQFLEILYKTVLSVPC